jgi:predicted RNase H-like HicB family nuclease
MATDLLTETSASKFEIMLPIEWSQLAPRTFECKVLLCPEEGGGFSAHALRLPGVVSEGENIDDALANIADAFRAAIQVYLESGAIPWTDNPVERAKGCQERWVLVNV